MQKPTTFIEPGTNDVVHIKENVRRFLDTQSAKERCQRMCVSLFSEIGEKVAVRVSVQKVRDEEMSFYK